MIPPRDILLLVRQRRRWCYLRHLRPWRASPNHTHRHQALPRLPLGAARECDAALAHGRQRVPPPRSCERVQAMRTVFLGMLSGTAGHLLASGRPVEGATILIAFLGYIITQEKP